MSAETFIPLDHLGLDGRGAAPEVAARATASIGAIEPNDVGGRSVLDRRPLEDIYSEIREVYLADSRPWVIGYSGGKDSTAVLQLVWRALEGLPDGWPRKPVYVIASDTQVETPVIVQRIERALARITEAARTHGLAISAHKVLPQLKDSFWVNLIGKGYPAPNTKFRWCTDRLKIQPANRFVQEKVAEFGEVVMVLGVRKAESSARAQVMSLHRREGSRLSRHTVLTNAYVYTPIEDWSTGDVWTYLLQVPSPWGDDNRDLVALYRSAQAGECPLVIDKTTPSCGNSRFGCWVCTVVEKDRTMEALVDAGEEWLEPLLDFRDLLAKTQDPIHKLEYRDYRRKSGHLKVKDGKIVPGPYKLEFCKELLGRLLETQHRVQTMAGGDPSLILISHEELHEIRRIWRIERQDWDDSVPHIYHEVTGSDLDWVDDDVGSFSGQDRRLLEEVCTAHDVPPSLVAKLLDVERDLAALGRRTSIFSRLETVLRQEWRPFEEVRARYTPGAITESEPEIEESSVEPDDGLETI